MNFNKYQPKNSRKFLNSKPVLKWQNKSPKEKAIFEFPIY